VTDMSILKNDSKKMYEIYDKWHEIANKSSSFDKTDLHEINHIVFAGMGGSGTVSDIFASILSKTNVYVSVVKGYVLPKTVNPNTLVITISVSGDTEETLTILKEAHEKNCKIIAFSSGGKMLKYCEENNIEIRNIEKIHSPRASLVTFVYTILNILEPILPIEKIDILDSINQLKKLQIQINSSNLNETNPALNLAKWISGIPLIYYPSGLKTVAIRFKNSLQENAKQHTIVEDVIESCHNGIVSWEKKSNVKPILIQGYDDYFKTKERWEILKEYFKTKNIEFYEIKSVKGGILSKTMTLIYLLDYSSIYCALLNNIDPSPVNSIDFIKRKLEYA
jgi:glucose/mannose-6-phosphate isomerase